MVFLPVAERPAMIVPFQGRMRTGTVISLASFCANASRCLFSSVISCCVLSFSSRYSSSIVFVTLASNRSELLSCSICRSLRCSSSIRSSLLSIDLFDTVHMLISLGAVWNPSNDQSLRSAWCTASCCHILCLWVPCNSILQDTSDTNVDNNTIDNNMWFIGDGLHYASYNTSYTMATGYVGLSVHVHR